MKGLQRAVNIKLWPGNGESAKPWGKLKQDPELWDERGDTLVFFDHDRSDPSFRISSTLLRDTGSDIVIDMLLYGTVRSGASTRGVSYKIYMDPPSSAEGKIGILCHHITTRNFLAFLLGKALVGFTFYQALVDLHERLKIYLAPSINCEAGLRAFLITTGLANVSNEPRAAAGLLAWSEDIRWKEGWREAFVHAVGMYQQIESLHEIADISPATQAHMRSAHLELQIRVREVEYHLATFFFNDAHSTHVDKPSTAQEASLRFRKFLKQYYEKKYQAWPIKSNRQNETWLNRRITSRLQQDFAALYEYCVDREVKWDEDGDDDKCERSRDWETPGRKGLLKSNNFFLLDAEDFGMLSNLRNLDCSYNRANLPHPYPLLPPSIPALSPISKWSIFSKGNEKDKIRELRVAHAYATANNGFQWSREHAWNDLAKAFSAFEKSEFLDNVNPREARRERWIIIYSVLQALAGISVDVPQLSFKNYVDYFLNARLQSLPPWSHDKNVYMEASYEQSHCWTAAKQWADSRCQRHTPIDWLDRSSSFMRSERSCDSRLESHSSSSAPLAMSPESQVLASPFLNRAHYAPSPSDLKGHNYRSNIPSLFRPSLTEGSSSENQSTLTSEDSRDNDHPIPFKFTKIVGFSKHTARCNAQDEHNDC